MPTQRALSGAAHDLAHHAASGLSYLSPYLGQALRDAHIPTTTVHLLQPDPYPPGMADVPPRRLALQALSKTAGKILAGYGFSKDDVVAIDLSATSAPWDETGFILHTRAVITVDGGRSFDSGCLQ